MAELLPPQGRQAQGHRALLVSDGQPRDVASVEAGFQDAGQLTVRMADDGPTGRQLAASLSSALDALVYGAMQAALFYLVLSMGMATLLRSEAAGVMGIAAILGFNGLISGFGENQVRISPFWNAHALGDADPTELFAWTLQNRIGIILAMAAILALAFMRANRRERMLGA